MWRDTKVVALGSMLFSFISDIRSSFFTTVEETVDFVTEDAARCPNETVPDEDDAVLDEEVDDEADDDATLPP